jgi:SNF2 family DNA or RNA helicase
VCTGTLEEKIDQMIEDKKALADLVVGDGEGWLTELSSRELRKVFALSDGAIGE